MGSDSFPKNAEEFGEYFLSKLKQKARQYVDDNLCGTHTFTHIFAETLAMIGASFIMEHPASLEMADAEEIRDSLKANEEEFIEDLLSKLKQEVHQFIRNSFREYRECDYVFADSLAMIGASFVMEHRASMGMEETEKIRDLLTDEVSCL